MTAKKKTYVKPAATTTAASPAAPATPSPGLSDASGRVRVGLSITEAEEKQLKALAFLTGASGIASYISERLIGPHLAANAAEIEKVTKLQASIK